MSQLTKAQLQEILPDVRAAYRLLSLYQARVLGTVQHIANKLGLAYNGGYSKFSDVTPRDGYGRLDNWAWDWLNMYHYEFNFKSWESAGKELHLSVFIQSDTGFYDRPNAIVNQLDTFASVEASATRLQFLVGSNLWHSAVAKEFALTQRSSCTEYTLLTDANTPGGLLIVKSFPLEEFSDEQAIDHCLTELVTFCNANGIPELRLAAALG